MNWRKKALEDPLAPPKEECVVKCQRCGKRYMSSVMLWRRYGGRWLWMCSTKGCDGVGFGRDINPVG